MGNQSSSHSSHGHSHSKKSSALAPPHEPAPPITTTVDGGFLEPQSHLYASSQQEYSRPTVHKLILERRLAPFYLGLNDFEPDWDVDDLVNALEDGDKQASTNLREALAAATEAAAEAEVYQSSNPTSTRKGKEAAAALAAANLHKERLAEIIKVRDKKGGGLQWSSKPDQAKLYLGEAVECPICFLYYPPPLVHTRCCDQPICTECFVQIKRADPTTTHLESEPAACPFCMETNFGCLYLKLEQRRPEMLSLDSAVSTGSGGSSSISIPTTDTPKPRRKSFAHTEKQVVTTDQLHPDWEAKVEAIKATVARRANRRVVFRQVGDRLIPVGITSGRESDGANATMSTTALPPGFAAQVAAAMDANNSNSGGSGRRAARRRNQEMTQYLESMGVGVGQDLEELMVMEAMRLSLAEDEERQKKEREERERAAQAGGATEGTEAETSAQGALRGSPDDPHTADMLSDAISTPIGSSPPARTPILSTSSQSIPAPSFSAASSSTSSPSRSPPPSSSHTSKPSLGALAAGGLAAVTSTPRAASAFPTPGESTDGSSLARGIVGAGLTGASIASSSRSSPSPSPSPAPASTLTSAGSPQLPPLPPQTPLVPSSSVPTVVVDTSSAHATPSSSSLSPPATSSSANDESDDEPDIPLTPSQGYQQLEDDDEGEATAGGDSKGSNGIFVPTSGSSHSLVDVS